MQISPDPLRDSLWEFIFGQSKVIWLALLWHWPLPCIFASQSDNWHESESNTQKVFPLQSKPTAKCQLHTLTFSLCRWILVSFLSSYKIISNLQHALW
jgi:hypothetical protein